MMPVAILCGGKATRLAPLTNDLPKSLVDVCGVPFIAHQFRLLKHAGYTDIVLCIGHLGQAVQAFVNDGSAFGVSVRCSYDPAASCGTARALTAALPLLGPRFFVLYGDSYLDCDYGHVEAEALKFGAVRTTYCGEDYGLMALTPTTFRQWPATGTPLIDAIFPCEVLEMPRPWHEIGSPAGLAELRRTLCEGHHE